jgi:hypothetical protein
MAIIQVYETRLTKGYPILNSSRHNYVLVIVSLERPEREEVDIYLPLYVEAPHNSQNLASQKRTTV